MLVTFCFWTMLTQFIALVTTPPDQPLIPTGDDLLVRYCLHDVARITSSYSYSTLTEYTRKLLHPSCCLFSSSVVITPEAPFYGSISSPVIDSQLCSVRIYV